MILNNEVSAISRIIKVSVRVITKTESNNCFISIERKNGNHLFGSSLTGSNAKRANLT